MKDKENFKFNPRYTKRNGKWFIAEFPAANGHGYAWRPLKINPKN